MHRGEVIISPTLPVQKNEDATTDECVFCTQFATNQDEKHFVLKRLSSVAIMMNLYPYNAGHLLILPYEHCSSINDLSPNVRNEFFEAVNIGIEGLKKIVKPGGFNVGMNLGKLGGAGIPSHLHMHVVPRWTGDTNFFAVISETKAVSYDLDDLYHEIKPAFDTLSREK